jgi:ferric-dicitrate binding protein FerR (iron transport regulator)
MSDPRQRSGQVAGDAADAVDAQVIAPLRNARLEPDDLQLARLGAALDVALQEATDAKTPAKTPEPKPVRRRGRWVGGIALAAAAAAAFTIGLGSRRTPAPRAPERARTALSIARDGDVALAAPRPLAVPAGKRVQGRIGERVRFTLVGPGEFSAFAVVGGTELELARGRLLLEYDGNGGEDILRVRSPGAVTTVVGTLFAVEARGQASRVAVARGAVTVESISAGVRRIAAGRSWRTEVLDTEPLSSELAADLAVHDAGAANEAPEAPRASQAPVRPRASATPRVAAPGERPPFAETNVRQRRASRAHDAADAEAAYAAAEESMRAGSTVAARKMLLDIVAAHPGDARAELALLDLARLALAAGHPVEARGYLRRLLSSTNDEALVDLGRQIQRRIDAAETP